MALKAPEGGVDWPSPLAPQQETVSLELMPQLWLNLPEEIALKEPDGGMVSPRKLLPQQVTVSLDLMPQL